MLYVESINKALHQMMKFDSKIVLIGEDLLDPYGGAFKVSKGLSTNYPEQVISTPISEQAIFGAAIGMSMRGLKPIVDIMFGDFFTLCVDQIVNHATKYHWMFNEQVNVPIVVRVPMGGGRGYGPTHSQTLESMFMSVSGIKICAPSNYHNPGEMLKNIVLFEDHPVLFVENKKLYPNKLQLEESVDGLHIKRRTLSKHKINETVLISLYPDEQADVVIITYGGMVDVAVDVALELFLEYEILIHIIAPSVIREFYIDDLIPIISQTRRVLILEEGNKIGGWGAEIASNIYEKGFDDLLCPIQRIGAEDSPIPAALVLEEKVLPTKEKVGKAIHKMLQ